MSEIKIELRKDNNGIREMMVAEINSKDHDVFVALWCDKLTIIGLDRNITSFELKRH